MCRTLLFATASLLWSAAAATPARADCRDMTAIGRAPPGATAKRTITARDLIELRDIGDPFPMIYGAPSRLAVSPDGKRVAFSLVRADLATNGYCLALYTLDLRPAASPVLVDAGGDYRPSVSVLRGYRSIDGSMLATVPLWSPDGRYLAFLRRDAGVTQAWIAASDGSGSRAVSRETSDVNSVGWSADGARLLYSITPGIAAAERDIDREGESGWLYDPRVYAGYSLRPLVAGGLARQVRAAPVAGGAPVAADAADIQSLPPDADPGMPVPPEARFKDRRAWTERAGGGVQSPLQLFVEDGRGGRIACAGDWCQGGIVAWWWAPAGDALYVERREGWNKENVTFYRWTPGAAKPVALLSTTDTVQDCVPSVTGFACTLENATTPRRIVAIDRGSGKVRTLFDPNPAFANIALGSVRRLKASNDLGLPSWADLVLPPDYKPGTKLPLVVVQYISQGFLRGGTGNDYPIYLLAARGFAVLSFERPPLAALASPKIKTQFDLNRTELRNWAERRNNLSALLAELDLAVATGTIDDKRVGITGQSDGSSTVRFAMINSKRFAAAAISTCCFDPVTVTATSGIALSDYLQKMGFPPLTKPDHDFWKDYSLAVSGARTDTPLLMLLADHEASNSLETLEALREYGKPVEAYIFPDEYHTKWQPAHRAAVYARAIDWFDFWLNKREDPDPGKRAQYERWRAMRAARTSPAP